MGALQAASVCMWLVALGFGLPTPFAAAYLLREGRLPTFMGSFSAYGGGLFERAPHDVFVVALALFAAVCAIDAFAATLVWNGERIGALLMIVTLPIEAIFWIGFALPIPPMLALVRSALLAIGWSALR